MKPLPGITLPPAGGRSTGGSGGGALAPQGGSPTHRAHGSANDTSSQPTSPRHQCHGTADGVNVAPADTAAAAAAVTMQGREARGS